MEKDEEQKNFEVAQIAMAKLTDDARLAIFAEYCTECGCDDPGCQCWNDE